MTKRKASELRERLFDEDTVFRFYSKSKDVPPGKGPGETIPPGRSEDFKELASIKDWRKKLSNFWLEEMEIDGLKWASVEHFYQANKYRQSCPPFYRSFSLSYKRQESDPRWLDSLPRDLATDPAVAKALGGKTGKCKKLQYRPKDMKLDHGFFENGISEKAMRIGQEAKYQQSQELREVLLATKDAKLTHYVRGSQPVVFRDTMKIRRLLSEE